MSTSKHEAHNGRHASNLEAPILFLQGYKDRLVPHDYTYKIFNNVATKDKTLVLVGQSEHLVLEEGQFNAYTFDSLMSWIDKHSKNTSTLVTASDASKSDQPVEKKFADID